MKVIKTGHHTYTGPVYDLQIKGDLEYNAEGFVVHNSVGGSLVAYLLKIHDADPFLAKLPFYRFLNPNRVEAPDIDIDFPGKARDAVIQYIKDQYGIDNVCHIGTCQTNQAKGCIQDWARLASIDKPITDAFSNSLPQGVTFSMLEDQKKTAEVEKFLNLSAHQPLASKPIDILKLAEGSVRAYGKHASGILVSSEKIDGIVPMFRNKMEDPICTQFDMDAINQLKMCKIDILGLKQLDVLNLACESIGMTREALLSQEVLNDPEALALVNKGMTAGVFQLNTPSFIRILKGNSRRGIPAYRCESVRDVMHLVALNRPGPKDYKTYDEGLHQDINMIEEYTLRMHNPDRVTFSHPLMERILGETRGIIIYQEQIMQIARQIADYTLEEADALRKFVAKKAIEHMSAEEKKKKSAEQRDKFVSKCMANAMPRMTEASANELWEIVETFGRYGFNMCLTEGTKVCIMDPDNLIKTVSIEDVKSGDQVPTFDEDGKLKWTLVDALHSNGTKQCVEVTFNDMSTVTCTEDHKFMTTEGMVPLKDIVTRQLEVIALDSDSQWTPDGRSEQNRGLDELLRSDLSDPTRVVSGLSFMCNIPGLSDKEPKEDAWQCQPFRNDEAGCIATGNHNVYASGDSSGEGCKACSMAHQSPEGVSEDSIQGQGSLETEPIIRNGELCGIAITGFGSASPDTIRILQETSRLCREIVESSLVGRDGRSASLLRDRRGESLEGSSNEGSEVGGSRSRQEGLLNQNLNEVLSRNGSSKDDDPVEGTVSQSGGTQREWRVLPRRVILVRPVGLRPTYDLQVADRTHRFLLANKIVTSNSHSYFYAMTVMMGAWLKAHYPVTFLGACLSIEKDDDEKTRLKSDAATLGIQIAPPSINISGADVGWEEDTKKIYMGLNDIKNTKSDDMKVIVHARQGGPFLNLIDFTERCMIASEALKKNSLDRGTIARLAWAGVMDDLVPEIPEGKREFICSVMCSDKLPTEFLPPEDRKLEKSKEKPYTTNPLERHANQWVRLYELGYNEGKPGLLAIAKANKTRKKQEDLYELYHDWPPVFIEEDKELLDSTNLSIFGHTLQVGSMDMVNVLGTIASAKSGTVATWLPKEQRTVVTAIVRGSVSSGKYAGTNKQTGQPKDSFFVGFDIQDETGELRCVQWFESEGAAKTLKGMLKSGRIVNVKGHMHPKYFKVAKVTLAEKKGGSNAA